MLLTITTTALPATDLGYLLHKNPARLQSFDLAFGTAQVFYPEADKERCTATLLLDIDPVRLVRGKGAWSGERPLDQYVNDRPYVASSFLSVAIAQVYRDALSGRSRERPELAQTALPLEAHLPVVPSRGGEEFVRRLFEPLGYHVETEILPLDPSRPDWGNSPYVALRLKATTKLSDLLSHLYVLIPVLDDDKHYWVGDDEVEKLLRRGEAWLASHPERDAIAYRYLNRRGYLAREAISQLTAQLLKDDADSEDAAPTRDAEEAAVEEKLAPSANLHAQRLNAVSQVLRESGARRVLDLGCGEGRLLKLLLEEKQFAQIVGLDVSHRALEIARDRLRFDRMPPMQRERITLWHGSLTYRDARLQGFDAAAVVEVIEHLDPSRLQAFSKVLWGAARPQTVVLTTPNAEYNTQWLSLPAGKFRHADHRFEWTRDEFQKWAQDVASRFDYDVQFAPVGPIDDTLGAPSQMGIFSRRQSTLVANDEAASESQN